MIYLIITVLFVALMLLYFKVADKFNIVDKPNERSSHTVVTLRGGGIIFWFAALFYFVLHVKTNYLFFTGITLVSLVSFVDDIQSLSGKLRAAVQFIAISLLFYDVNLFNLEPWWIILIAYIVSVGITNAYNFMDGINGITGIYTISVLLSFLIVNNWMDYELVNKFVDNDFLIFPLIASVVFLYFNYRKKAKCFAGDVGSIAIAFWLIYLMMLLILKTNSIIWLLFLAVYGVDTVCTIVHRIWLKQNIFKPHRLHFYQILSNERKIDHRLVSAGYGLLQLGISLIVVRLYGAISDAYLAIIVLLPMILLYLLKFKLIKKIT